MAIRCCAAPETIWNPRRWDHHYPSPMIPLCWFPVYVSVRLVVTPLAGLMQHPQCRKCFPFRRSPSLRPAAVGQNCKLDAQSVSVGGQRYRQCGNTRNELHSEGGLARGYSVICSRSACLGMQGRSATASFVAGQYEKCRISISALSYWRITAHRGIVDMSA